MGERQSQIGVGELRLRVAREQVAEPQHAPGAVDHEFSQLDGRLAALELKDVAGEAQGSAEIVEEVRDPGAGQAGHDLPIARGDRLENPEIEFVVENEHRPVPWGKGVGDLDARGVEQIELLFDGKFVGDRIRRGGASRRFFARGVARGGDGGGRRDWVAVGRTGAALVRTADGGEGQGEEEPKPTRRVHRRHRTATSFPSPAPDSETGRARSARRGSSCSGYR